MNPQLIQYIEVHQRSFFAFCNMDRDKKQTLCVFLIGIIIGILIEGQFIRALCFIYLYLILIARLGIKKLWKLGEKINIAFLNENFNGLFSDTNNKMTYSYDIINNIITIEQPFTSRIIQNRSDIEKMVHQVMNVFKFFDIFYHLIPLKIVFK